MPKKHRILLEIETDTRVTQEMVRQKIAARLPHRAWRDSDGLMIDWSSLKLMRSRTRTTTRAGRPAVVGRPRLVK